MEHAITQDLADSASQRTRELQETSEKPDFPVVLRGYERTAVDAYVLRTSRLIAELRAQRSPDAAVQKALDQVGEEVASILRRAHEAAEQMTVQSRREADDRLQRAQREALEITAGARARLRDLDSDTDRIWAERHRIVEDARSLAAELAELAELASERFPASEEPEEDADEVLGLDEAASEDDEQAGEEAEDGEAEADDARPYDAASLDDTGAHDEEAPLLDGEGEADLHTSEIDIGEEHSAVLRVSRAQH